MASNPRALAERKAREAHAVCPCSTASLVYACGPIWCEHRPNVATTTSTIQTPVVGTHACLWPGHAALDAAERVARRKLFEEHEATCACSTECWMCCHPERDRLRAGIGEMENGDGT